MYRHHWITRHQKQRRGKSSDRETNFISSTDGRTNLSIIQNVDRRERQERVSIEHYESSDVAGDAKDEIDQGHVRYSEHHHHMETEKLTSSLRNACHQPGGKKSKSPGSSVAVIASGTTSSQNRGNLSESAAKTSTWEVLDNCGNCLFVEGLRWETVYSAEDTLGGASHTVLRPTT